MKFSHSGILTHLNPLMVSYLVHSGLYRWVSLPFWWVSFIVIRKLGSVDCIYTNSRLSIGNYAVEHFIPYAFVSHDLIWNLIPADQSFNSSKSDKLPNLDQYFEPFYKLQESAKEIVQYKYPKNRFLEDYLTIFPSLGNEHFNQQKFLESLQPLVTIASNNGFEYFR